MCIRPILLYACPIWSNTCDSNYKRLQIVQNKCLKMICNAKPRTRINDLHKQLNVPKIKEIIETHTINFYNNKLKILYIKILCDIL